MSNPLSNGVVLDEPNKFIFGEEEKFSHRAR